jgi:hypothetical protein
MPLVVIPSKAEIINAVMPAKAGIQAVHDKAALWAAFHLCGLRPRVLVGG